MTTNAEVTDERRGMDEPRRVAGVRDVSLHRRRARGHDGLADPVPDVQHAARERGEEGHGRPPEGLDEVTITTGRKDDGADGAGPAKPRWDLLPTRAVTAIVKVLTFGAMKYGDENWRLVAAGRRRYLAAAYRHIIAWQQGEKLDPESGQPHLAHAACCILFLAELDGE